MSCLANLRLGCYGSHVLPPLGVAALVNVGIHPYKTHLFHHGCSLQLLR